MDFSHLVSFLTPRSFACSDLALFAMGISRSASMPPALDHVNLSATLFIRSALLRPPVRPFARLSSIRWPVLRLCFRLQVHPPVRPPVQPFVRVSVRPCACMAAHPPSRPPFRPSVRKKRKWMWRLVQSNNCPFQARQSQYAHLK